MTPLIPADNCPLAPCLAGPWLPWTGHPQPDGTGVYAYYTCLSCGHSWRTGWAVEALSEPGRKAA